jgi:tight adherence protein B
MAASGDGHGERVDILSAAPTAGMPALDKLLRRVARLALLDRLLLQAGVRWSVAQFLGSSVSAAAVALLLLQILQMPFAGRWRAGPCREPALAADADAQARLRKLRSSCRKRPISLAARCVPGTPPM